MAVLHMILIVFKILGVFLLIILGILMLAVAVILFCPVRYRAEGYKDERTYGGEVGISWLFHLISFRIWYESKKGKAEYSVRILGIPVLKLISGIADRKEKKGRQKAEQPLHTEISLEEKVEKKKETSKKAWSPGIGTSSGAVSLLSDRSLSGNGVLVSNRDCVGVKCTEDRGFSSY